MEDYSWKTANWHIHTTASDGIYTPRQVVIMAKKAGLKEIAITDHDSIGGIAEAEKEGKKLGIKVLPGVELTCYDPKNNNKEVHITGIGLDEKNKNFKRLIYRAAADRVERARKIVNKLSRLGYNLSWKKIASLGKGVVTRPHIARIFLSNKNAADKLKKRYNLKTLAEKDVFKYLIAEGRPAYVEKMQVSPKQAINAIKGAGGIPVLAHPGGEKNATLKVQFKDIKRYAKYGLRGIEAYYPTHSIAQSKRFVKIARQLNLVITTGTDFHGRAMDRLVYHKI